MEQHAKLRKKADRHGQPDERNALVSRRILLLANVLRRAAGLRYRRLLGLANSEWGIIAEVGTRAPRTLNDLAASMALDKAQLSRTVTALVEQGFVLRRANPQDKREVFLRLSVKGESVYAELMAAGLEANRRLLDGFGPDDRARLNAQIDLLMARATEMLQAEQALRAEPSGE